MIHVILNIFSGFPRELATFLIGMTPVGEIRLAVPIAVLVYKLPVWEAFFLGSNGKYGSGNDYFGFCQAFSSVDS
jgi:hypothetical protein